MSVVRVLTQQICLMNFLIKCFNTAVDWFYKQTYFYTLLVYASGVKTWDTQKITGNDRQTCCAR